MSELEKIPNFVIFQTGKGKVNISKIILMFMYNDLQAKCEDVWAWGVDFARVLKGDRG